MKYYDSLGAAGYPISGRVSYEESFQEHLDRGSRGGLDYAVGIGRPIYAPTRGRVLNRWTSGGGNTVRYYHIEDNGQETGWYDEFLHLSSFGLDNGYYLPGEDIGARSGNSGSQTTGPHIHWHLCDPAGNRQRQWLYFRDDPVPPAPIKKKDTDMYYNRVVENGWHYVVTAEYIRVITKEEIRHVTHNMGAPKDHAELSHFIFWCQALGIPESVVRALSPTNRNWSKLDTITGGGGATPAQIAAAVDASLKDDFAGIPKSVNDDVAKRMSS